MRPGSQLGRAARTFPDPPQRLPDLIDGLIQRGSAGGQPHGTQAGKPRRVEVRRALDEGKCGTVLPTQSTAGPCVKSVPVNRKQGRTCSPRADARNTSAHSERKRPDRRLCVAARTSRKLSGCCIPPRFHDFTISRFRSRRCDQRPGGASLEAPDLTLPAARCVPSLFPAHGALHLPTLLQAYGRKRTGPTSAPIRHRKEQKQGTETGT